MYAVPGGGGDVPDCSHDSLGEFASNGLETRYLRCPDCATVLLVTRKGIQPARPAHDLGSVDTRLDDLLADIDRYHGGDRNVFGPDREADSTLRRVFGVVRRIVP